ncbi:MAG: MBL fold metallo-hydrolase [Candidatus Moranbacteria bacterium]|nr:MBL fold metallo-hydrolase [Candidatus Moranbacteria bacterium]
MIINYIGHACFKIQTQPNPVQSKNKLIIYFDPFDKSVGLNPPSGKADLVLSSHDHFDHNNTQNFESGFFFVNNPGEYSYQGVNIKGILSYHDQEKGAQRGLNTIFVVESEKIKICHLGDLGHELSQNQLDQIGAIDILMIPVGGKFTISGKQAARIAKSIEPAFILPMHFQTPSLSISGLEPKESFYKELGLEPKQKVDKLKITSSSINHDEIEVMEFS